MFAGTQQSAAVLRLLPVLATVLCTVVVAACNDRDVPTCDFDIVEGNNQKGGAPGRRLTQAAANADLNGTRPDLNRTLVKRNLTQAELNERLWAAAVAGNLTAARAVVDGESASRVQAAVESRHGPFNNTPLIATSREGHKEVVQFLINSSADVNAVAADGASSLFLAAQFGQVDVVGVLIENEADVDLARAGWKDSPLFVAAQERKKDVVELLIQAGAGVNRPDNDSNTPLHVAAETGDEGIVDALLEARADPATANLDGVTPLHLACAGEDGSGAVVRSILEGNDEGRGDPTAADSEGSTPLVWAAWFGNLNAMKALLEEGVDLPPNETARALDQVCNCLGPLEPSDEDKEAGEPNDQGSRMPPGQLLQCPSHAMCSSTDEDADPKAELVNVLKNGMVSRTQSPPAGR